MQLLSDRILERPIEVEACTVPAGEILILESITQGIGMSGWKLAVRDWDFPPEPVPSDVVAAYQKFVGIDPFKLVQRPFLKLSFQETVGVLLCLWARYLVELDYVDFEPINTGLIKA